MDSESEFGYGGVSRRLLLLLSSASDGLSVPQAANILGIDVPQLLVELNLDNSVVHEVIAYDAAQQHIAIRPDAKPKLPDLIEQLRSSARNSVNVSDTERHSTSLIRQLRQSGYKSDTNFHNVRRRGAAVRKARAGLSLTQPTTHDQVGRVGYVCVADEFNLSALENHYRSQGYYTKFDFDVLHVRFADRDMHGVPDDVSNYGTTETTPPTTTGRGAGAGAPSSLHREGTEGETRQGSSAPFRNNGFDLFLFEYGAVVWWGFNNRYFKIVETDYMLPQSPISKYMTQRYPTQLVNENYPVWCTYNLVLKETIEVDQDFKDLLRFDHFLIPYGRGDPSTCSISMLCASHALAQSAKIDYLEIKVQELTLSCTPLPRELREKGTVTVSERRLLQLRGEVLSYRLMLRSGSDLIDEPSFFWENAYLKPVFQATKDGFEISSRVEALDNKLDATNEILSMLAEEFSQRHGARLEWIVIWLVFVEVIIGVLELCVDVRPWIRSD